MKNRRGEDRIKRNLYLYLNFLETCVLCVLYFNGGRSFPLRDQKICKCIGTKESVSTPIGINWSWLINKDLDDLTSATPMKTYCLEVSIHQNSREWLRRILPPPSPPPPHLSLYCTCPATCTMKEVRFEFVLTTLRNTDLVTFRKRYSSIPFLVV